jgi:hypothetical protein
MKFTVFLTTILVSAISLQAADSRRAAALAHIQSDIEFFASDEQEGRGVATQGIERSAQRIVAEYERIGLKPVMPDGGWRQTFTVKIGSTGPSPQTSLSFRNSRGTRLHLTRNEDYQPLQRGGEGKSSGGLVFVGYGISAPDDNYDEYADVDVEGKTIVVIRRVPGQGDVDSPFSGASTSPHAYIASKLKLAAEHKAAAVLFVNDPYTASDSATDELVAIDGFGPRGQGVPFLHIRQSILDQLLSESPLKTKNGELLTSLRAVAEYLDETMSPISQELDSWTVDVNVQFTGRSVEASNLIGVVEGQGPNAHETIIVGGHYDHIGFGDYGSRTRSRRGEIHNGADDNASGTAAVLEMARRIAAGPPPQRRIVFICFSGEERGLLGSRHYVKQPVFPLDDTVFMFNFDMIGSVRNNRVEVNGVGTAAEFLPLVEQADEDSALDVSIVSNPFGGSDHLPFYRKQIPVMFCFTGVTDRYHTPDDDIDMINMDGVVSVVELSEHLFHSIDELPSRPSYRKAARGRWKMAVLGVQPDLSETVKTHGVRVLGVRAGSPAKDAAVQVGDVIVRIDGKEIDGYASLNDFLRQATGGKTVTVTVERNGQQIGLPVRLGQASR